VHDIRRTYAQEVFRSHPHPAVVAALLGQVGTRMVSRYAELEWEMLSKANEGGKKRA